MKGYATITGTLRNLNVLRAAGWGLVLTPARYNLPEGFSYFLDNGAWPCFVNKTEWDTAAFMRLVEARGAGADFIVLPDIVAGGIESLKRSVDWMERLCHYPRLYIAVQDGMNVQTVCNVLSLRPGLGIFVGGSTEWKLKTLPEWGRLAADMHKPLHVGRVNTARRIRLCAEVGATSFDGTSVSRFACTLPLLEASRIQPSLLASIHSL